MSQTTTTKTVLYRRNPDFVHRRVSGEEILVPVRRHGAELSCLYMLNPTASWIWRHLERPSTRAEILEALLDSFEVERPVAEQDLDRFVAELVEIGALDEENSP